MCCMYCTIILGRVHEKALKFLLVMKVSAELNLSSELSKEIVDS